MAPFSFTWIEKGRLAACSAPASTAALEELAAHGIRRVVNLHLGAHAEGRLATYGMRELHLPVEDMTAPSTSQITEALAAIDEATRKGEPVAVHCVAGLGRAGTIVACWLVTQGMDPDAAIKRVRELRPGSIETPEQVAAVRRYAARAR